MDAEKLIPATDSQKRLCRCATCRTWVILALLFALLFAVSWWLAPIEPYASLNVDDEWGRFFFSPDGTMLVTLGKQDFGRSKGPLRVWDVARGQERFSIAPDWKAIETVLFSPDNSLLAAHEMGGSLKLWNTQTGRRLRAFRAATRFNNWVNFQFSPDGRFLVMQDYRKGWLDKDYLTFWNIETGREHGTVESYFNTLAFAPDGHSFATFRRKDHRKINEVLLWKMDRVPVLVKQHQISAREVAFAPDLHTFAAADDLADGIGQLAIRDMTTGEKRWSATFNEHGTHLQSLAFIANGNVLATHGGGGSQLDWRWRTTLWDLTARAKEIDSFSETPTISPDGEWIAIPLDSGAKLIKVSAQTRGNDLAVHGDLGPSAFGTYNNMKRWPKPSFSPDGTMILVRGLHRLEQERFLGKWPPSKYNPICAAPSGSVVRLWDVRSRREMLAFSKCREAAFSPDQKVLATLRDGSIDLWNVPFRGSFWLTLGWAVFVWLIVVSICWLGFRIRKRLFSPWFVRPDVS